MKKKRDSNWLFLTMDRGKRIRRYNRECVAFVAKLPVVKRGHETIGRKRIPQEWERRDGRVIAPR